MLSELRTKYNNVKETFYYQPKELDKYRKQPYRNVISLPVMYMGVQKFHLAKQSVSPLTASSPILLSLPLANCSCTVPVQYL
jgi:hypothetical protein